MRVAARSRSSSVESKGELEFSLRKFETEIAPCQPLRRRFFARDPRIVARQLLGCWLISEVGGALVSGIIVETEGYLATGDSACHAARGRTAKSEVMFGVAGIAYVYPIHARHCFNVVTETAGRPSAVLVRAIRPMQGLDLMRHRRGTDGDADLARGPARLCEALGIDRSRNGLDLTAGQDLWIGQTASVPLDDGAIRVTPRIGVTSAHRRRLRFVIAGSPYASGPRYWR